MNTKALVLGVAAVAAGKYFLDPELGAARRAKVREKASELAKDAGELIESSKPQLEKFANQFSGNAPGGGSMPNFLGTGAGLLLSRALGKKAGWLGMVAAAYSLWQQKKGRTQQHEGSQALEPMQETPLPAAGAH